MSQGHLLRLGAKLTCNERMSQILWSAKLRTEERYHGDSPGPERVNGRGICAVHGQDVPRALWRSLLGLFHSAHRTLSPAAAGDARPRVWARTFLSRSS